MDYNGVSVPLDADTGLAPEGTRAWYTETAKTENGENAKLKSVRLSDAYITYDEKQTAPRLRFMFTPRMTAPPNKMWELLQQA